jgi:altronate dehydratase large subunit
VNATFLGYVRDDGSIGVRDRILILPLAASLVPLAARVAGQVRGAATVTHEFESTNNADELVRVTRTFAGTSGSANVGRCVALGDSSLEPTLLEALAMQPRVRVLDVADIPSRERVVETAVELATSGFAPGKREPIPLSRLILGTECGGSDAWSGVTANPALGVASDWLIERGATIVLAETPELIGAEHLLAKRADRPELAELLLYTVGRYEQALADIGEEIRGAQPTVGNMSGGLTTIEEKSLGAAKKAGTGPIRGVVEYAERVPECAGVVVMDTPGHDIEQMTGMIAGGCQVVAFTTGRGTPTGSAIAPVLKIATNTPMFERLALDLDLDAGTVLAGEPLESVGERLALAVVATASGELTSAERRGATDFALSRFAWAPSMSTHRQQSAEVGV